MYRRKKTKRVVQPEKMRLVEGLKLPLWAMPAMRVLDVWRQSVAEATGAKAESVCPLSLVLSLAVSAPQTIGELKKVLASSAGLGFHAALSQDILRILNGARNLRKERRI